MTHRNPSKTKKKMISLLFLALNKITPGHCVFIIRFFCSSQRRVFVQAPSRLFRVIRIFPHGNSGHPLVVLFLDKPPCCSGTRILGNNNNTHLNCAQWLHESRDAASQLHQSSRLFLTCQFWIYLCVISRVYDSVEFGSSTCMVWMAKKLLC